MNCGGDWLRGSQEKPPPLVPIDQEQAAKSTHFYLPFHTHTQRESKWKKERNPIQNVQSSIHIPPPNPSPNSMAKNLPE